MANISVHKIAIALVVGFLLLFTNCSSDTGDSDTETESEEVDEQSIGEFTDDLTFKVFPKSPYNNFDNGEFRLWIPENSSNLKATLVVLAGSNGSALGLTESEEWRTYAEQENLALCGVFLSSTSFTNYTNAVGGSGQALTDAISEIAEKIIGPKSHRYPFC